MRVFIFILWLILGLIYFWLWDRGVDKCCNDDRTKIETAVVDKATVSTKAFQDQTGVKKDTGSSQISKNDEVPIAFYWGKSEIVKGKNFKAVKDSILATLEDGKVLEITGFYYEGELNNSGMDNLGLARAMVIRKLFSELPDEKIRLYGKQGNKKIIDKGNVFSASSFYSAVNNTNVKEIDKSALIYFPYNSTKKLKNPKIDSYLDDVVKRVVKTGEKIYLTGHTDDRGPDNTNYNLGLKRANIIKDILVVKGISAKNIVVKSEGEKSPIASNSTAEGRSKNRRVELKIFNK